MQSQECRDGEKQHNEEACIAVRAEEHHAAGRVFDVESAELPCHVPADRPRPAQRDDQAEGAALGAEDGGEHGETHDRDSGHEEATKPHRAVGTEEAGGGFHADEGVVFGVLVGVDRVVEEGPSDAGGVEDQRRDMERSGVGGEGQKRAPVEGKPKEDLWPPCEAFGEGVDRDSDHRQHAEKDGVEVEGEEDGEGDEGLDHHPDGGLFRSHLPRGDRAGAGAGDLSVELAVGDIVPRAARAAHEESACGASDENPEVEQAGLAVMQDAEEERPPAGQQQEPRADGAIRTGEAQVGA